MLTIEGLQAGYDQVPVLWDLSLQVPEGSVVAVIGANGAGKTTLLRTISGLIPPMQGTITFFDRRLNGLPPHKIAALGIAHVPEGRGVFAYQTVLRNLYLGAYLRPREEIEETLREVFALFPRLAERQDQMAGTLSGGEQQMLVIARGLMSRPRLLMLDEPSLGLMPKLVDEIFDLVRRIREEQGVTILLVEQNVREALEVADYAYVLQTGRVVLEGTGTDLLKTDLVRRAYLGL
ncbi:MAG: ABC transporter ATP-binding protein [Chloroflexi bacterium]|nr:MAG: ABC transporter ATP-binding protein [Chloroflexota bacterium]